jgi:hypothetical protein
MAAFAKAFDRVWEVPFDIETLRPLVVFCGAGFAISLLVASYGLDLSPGFF